MNVMERGAQAPAAATRPRRRRLVSRDTLSAYAFLLPNGLGFLAFTLIPIVASSVLSLFNWPLQSAPTFVGLNNYVDLVTKDPVFKRVLLNTLF